MTVIYKIFLYLSNYIPLYFLVYLKQLEIKINEDITFLDLYFQYEILWNILIAISVISIIATLFWLKGKKDYSTTFENLRPINENILSYFITYLIPLLSLNIGNIYSVYINLILFFIIGLFHIKFNYLHINIIIILLGYNVYSDDKTNKILITKSELSQLNSDEITVKQVGASNYFIY